MKNETAILPKGTVIKLNGVPLELAEDVEVIGFVSAEEIENFDKNRGSNNTSPIPNKN